MVGVEVVLPGEHRALDRAVEGETGRIASSTAALFSTGRLPGRPRRHRRRRSCSARHRTRWARREELGLRRQLLLAPRMWRRPTAPDGDGAGAPGWRSWGPCGRGIGCCEGEETPVVEVPAVPYKDPNNYVKYSGRLPKSWRRRSRTAPSGPTSSTTSPIAQAISRHGAGDLGADRRQGRRLHLRGRLRRHAGRRVEALKEHNPNVTIGLADPRAPRSTTTTSTAS